MTRELRRIIRASNAQSVRARTDQCVSRTDLSFHILRIDDVHACPGNNEHCLQYGDRQSAT